MDPIRRTFKPLALAVALALWTATTVQAQPHQRGEGRGPGQMIKRLDTNGDGKVSKDEFKGPEQIFSRMDADGDGFITDKELTSMRSRRGGPRGERGSGDDGAPKTGEVAPTFKLESLDGESEFDLASFKGKKPVMLFFGSYT